MENLRVKIGMNKLRTWGRLEDGLWDKLRYSLKIIPTDIVTLGIWGKILNTVLFKHQT